ncbi:uncharacterized protein LOC123538508 [Mercenaria mercenaria]|uniref:uncharacterized protein LOC123538508 n=1 Tax=Mercenaria mercenaria TaxID=6596 RepID=UPI00234F726A|nr:uncharacterized protein LOC123538508 [Mercenaria mercenaria]
MLSYFVCAILVMSSFVDANELDTEALEGFQSAIYGSIMAHLDAEYQLLQPLIAQQNQSMDRCRGQITVAQESCKTCASSHCQGDFGDWIMGGLGEMGGWFKGAGNSFVDWQGWQDIGGFFGDIGDWFGGAANSFVNWKGFDDMKNFFGGIGNAFSSGFNSIKHTFSSLGSSMGSGLSSFGTTLGSGLSDFGNTFKSGLSSVFGRRRRDVGPQAMTARKLKTIRHRYMAKRVEELDPETRQCMEQCSECTPFLGDQTALIGGVCGDQMLLDQAAMSEVMTNMQALFNANGNPLQGTTPIVSKIEFDQSDISLTDFSVGGVYVTAKTPNGVVRYPSNYRYKMQSPQTTADEIAQELIEKWNI